LFAVWLRAAPAGSPLFPYTTLFRSEAEPCQLEYVAQALGGNSHVVLRLGGTGAERLGHERAQLRHPCAHGPRRVLAERRGRVESSEEHTSELQSRVDLVCRLLLAKK